MPKYPRPGLYLKNDWAVVTRAIPMGEKMNCQFAAVCNLWKLFYSHNSFAGLFLRVLAVEPTDFWRGWLWQNVTNTIVDRIFHCRVAFAKKPSKWQPLDDFLTNFLCAVSCYSRKIAIYFEISGHPWPNGCINQGCHSPAQIKFPDFSRQFPWHVSLKKLTTSTCLRVTLW